MDNPVKVLVDRQGLSKYRIAKKVDVSWNTVQLWYKGIFKPTAKNLRKLKGLLHG